MIEKVEKNKILYAIIVRSNYKEKDCIIKKACIISIEDLRRRRTVEVTHLTFSH